MAHVGRFYKLWFRRDLHLEVFNSRGYAEAYQVFLHDLFGSDAADIESADWLCVNTLKDAGDLREWTSAYQHINGVDYRLRFSVISSINDRPTKGKFSVDRLGLGEVLAITAEAPSTGFVYQTLGWFQNATVITRVTPARIDGAAFPLFAQAADWNAYNP